MTHSETIFNKVFNKLNLNISIIESYDSHSDTVDYILRIDKNDNNILLREFEESNDIENYLYNKYKIDINNC